MKQKACSINKIVHFKYSSFDLFWLLSYSEFRKGWIYLEKKIFGSNGILGFDYGNQPYSSDLDKITLQHLLEQTDGFDSKLPEKCSREYYYKQNETYDQSAYDMKTFIGCVLDDTIENPIDTPGSKWQISSFGYVLLGRVIEKLSKMTYEKYVQNNVLEKCNAKNIHLGKNLF